MITHGAPPSASPDELADVVRDALREGPPLRLLVIFGSAAKGALRADSDVDVAYAPAGAPLSLDEELALAARLSRVLGRDVDLVAIEAATTLLRWQIASTGRPIVSEAPTEWIRFVGRAASEYGDFEPAALRVAEGFRRRLASRGR